MTQTIMAYYGASRTVELPLDIGCIMIVGCIAFYAIVLPIMIFRNDWCCQFYNKH